MSISELSDRFIRFSFYTLFFLVPLIWLPVNYELFEFNKMILVYLLTVVIITAWAVKSLEEKRLVIKRTFLDIPLLILLGVNFLATVFSMDPHTSVFGYYGRFNGGLLSTLCYVLLYFALVSNTNPKQILNYVYALLISSILVAVYGNLQHPNPLFRETVDGKTVFHGIDYDYWAVEVEKRVFSTLGQANWLAAFLAMTIFPLTALLFIYKKIWEKALIFLAISATYLAFTFTYSRGGAVGILAGIATFLALLPLYKKTTLELILEKIRSFRNLFPLKKQFSEKMIESFRSKEIFKTSTFWVVAIIATFFITNYFFGNALERRGTIPAVTPQNQPTQEETVESTQLEIHGQETAKIRTIVWSGALAIFKHYPILGTGVETFGYSYYLHRPVAHNNVAAEWDFLYNKAHNEFLNILATTGSLGFASYMFLIIVFEITALRFILNSNQNGVRLLSIALLAGYNSYLAQNFFGFSVVPIALLFFLYPAIFIILANHHKKILVLDLVKKFPFLYKNQQINLGTKIFAGFVGLVFVINVLCLWLGDYYYNKALNGETYNSSIQSLKTAAALNTLEPIYEAELALNYAGLATTSQAPEQIRDAQTQAREIINKVVALHPNNLELWKTKRVVDFTLSKIDKASELELLGTAEKLKTLAPTDASTQYDIGLVYSYLGKSKEAEEQLKKVVEMKSSYQEAVIMLAQTYIENKKNDEAIKLLQEWITKNPADSEAVNLLKELLTT